MTALLKRKPRLTLLYTEIGRGHPAYLDGITDLLSRDEARLFWQAESVFEISSGLSKQVWKTARWLYHRGASEGYIGQGYARLRQNGDFNRGGLMMTLLGLNIRRQYLGSQETLIVAHPILVGILARRKGLIYQHGEVVAPAESLVMGAETVMVPTQTVADKFIKQGYDKSQMLVTGLGLEAALVCQATDAFELRIKRLESSSPLTGAFFSSGAEPISHIDQLIRSADSLIKAGGRVVLFVKKAQQFEARLLRSSSVKQHQALIVSSVSELPAELPPMLIVSSSSRTAENRMFAQLFSEFDLIVAPPHERCNYALGLGLPIFMLEPVYGSFAPLNLENILSHQVGLKLGCADNLGSKLVSLRADGALIAMAMAGWQKYDINGYQRIVNWLLEHQTEG